MKELKFKTLQFTVVYTTRSIGLDSKVATAVDVTVVEGSSAMSKHTLLCNAVRDFHNSCGTMVNGYGLITSEDVVFHTLVRLD